MAYQSLPDLLRIAVPSGLLAGLASGIIARIAMRVFALADGSRPTFTIVGTLGVVFVFAVLLGIPLALPYLRYWRAISPDGSWTGVTYGVLLLVLLVAIPFMLIPHAEATLRVRLLAIAVFVPVPLTYGITLGRITKAVIARM